MQWWMAALLLVALALPIGLLYKPLGNYIAWVFTSPDHWRVERWIYKVIGVNPNREHTWQSYLRAVLVFSAVGLILLYLIQRLQPWLPYSLGLPPVSPDVAFNTAASFVGNTNWQSYSPEPTMGYTAQMAGLAVQMFLSAAVGICVSIALTRGIAYHKRGTLGNFWVDVVRATFRILLPMTIIASVILLTAGVIQNFAGFTTISTVAGGTQVIPGGPVASQEAIKMLGTNGGGFFNANSAHPFENPTPWENLFQIFMLLVIPFAMPRAFGKIVGDHRMGYVVMSTMAALFTIAYVTITASELAGSGTAPQLAGAAMEGKEQRFGIISSTLFATATTGTSGGAANSMHSSYTAFGGMVEMMHMMLGEISPGGVGAGLYTMLVMVLLGAFLTGLLLGRAPVFLGKRLGVTEVKLVGIFILVLPVLALGGLGISMAIPPVRAEIANFSMSTGGPHGMSEAIYAFVSVAINNGSAFAGFDANTPYLNTVFGVLILLGRFIPIALVLALAGSFASQGRATSRATELPLHRPQFVLWLVILIIYIAIPSFIPVLLVGPLAEGLH